MKDHEALRAHEVLVRGGGLRPVGLGGGRRFALWELASLAELAPGETVEPEGLGVGGERRVRKRLGRWRTGSTA
ncbi:hypothetical protein ACGF4C_36835 [Streptomyces sp. NPDC048197]|uniref:hypothetical protein n=1 Tax=Streptomyces sp. NPDC048197 TaxID=3365511 RepID=UPI00371F9D1C